MSTQANSMNSTEAEVTPGPLNRTLGIFLVSVLGLFLEMLLIRWIGTEIRIFAYLQNTVLIVCFLGLGMGCFTCHRPVRIYRLLTPLFCLTAILAIPITRGFASQITELLSVLPDMLIWEPATTTDAVTTLAKVGLGLGMTFVLMVLLWEIFLPLGRLLGRYLDDHPKIIWAYSVNVAGSLVGIGLFVVLSAMYMSPFVWFLVAGGLLLWFLGKGRQRTINLVLLTAIIVAAWSADKDPNALEVVWSPYQRLGVLDLDQYKSDWPGSYLISVNNAGYQGIIDLSHEGQRKNKQIPPDMYGYTQYDLPLLFHPKPDRVLVVGAGTGNDVAGALRRGAKHVTAVEIDPAIIEMGRRYHPEQPYSSPKVKVVIDDARSFFATTDEKFDLIIFGLLDSHTTTAMTNARLDHYVYTKESIARARTLLLDKGVMVLSFEAVKPYIADRMASCIRAEFGYEPLVFRAPSGGWGWGGVLFVTGDRQVVSEMLDQNPILREKITQWQAQAPIDLTYTTSITSDDWPYIYLQGRKIPTLYYLLGALMVGLLVYCRRRLQLKSWFGGWSKSHWHFFFLGAAFLLLEVQNISKAAVVLGNTWVVNAIIISGILLMILLANVIAARFPKLPTDGVVFCLIGSCVALYFVDLSRFGFLPYATKALLIGTLTTLPMLFSGIIFIRSFAAAKRKDLALGANLIGSLVGGLLQSITFIVGIKALLLVVACLYMVAALTRPKNSQDELCSDDLDQSREREEGTAEDEADSTCEDDLVEPVGV